MAVLRREPADSLRRAPCSCQGVTGDRLGDFAHTHRTSGQAGRPLAHRFYGCVRSKHDNGVNHGQEGSPEGYETPETSTAQYGRP